MAASNQATITRLIAQASCRDNFGIDLNTGAYDVLGLKAIHPMELPSAANSAKVSVIYTK